MSHQLKSRWLDADIEERICALVRTLNRDSIGLRTIASCQGHFASQLAPYVYFTCPVIVAVEIHRFLQSIPRRGGGLNFPWSLRGAFTPDFQICFFLESPKLEQTLDHLFSPFFTFVINREKIDDDLDLLASRLMVLLDDLETDARFTTANATG